MPICPAPKICLYSGWLNALAHLVAYTSDVAGLIYSPYLWHNYICMSLFYLERHLGKPPPGKHTRAENNSMRISGQP
jgi:hypothetical protein